MAVRIVKTRKVAVTRPPLLRKMAARADFDDVYVRYAHPWAANQDHVRHRRRTTVYTLPSPFPLHPRTIRGKGLGPRLSPTYRTLTGWNDSCKDLKQDADFWYNIWNEAGRPPSGILSDIKKSTKRKYKSSVRQLKRKQNQLKREKLAKSFAKNKKDGFWSAVKQLKRGSTSRVSVVDDCTDSSDIANIFASNICRLLNTHSPALRNSMLASTKSKLTANELTGMSMSEDEVYDAVSSLKNRKTDSLGLSSEHLKYACPVIVHDLSAFFTACFRHCYILA